MGVGTDRCGNRWWSILYSLEELGIRGFRSVNWVSEMAKLCGFNGGGGGRRQKFNVGVLAGILVILLPVFFPTMFKPLSHASPSFFSVMLDFILVNYLYILLDFVKS